VLSPRHAAKKRPEATPEGGETESWLEGDTRFFYLNAGRKQNRAR
jgi:hypothetical protein